MPGAKLSHTEKELDKWWHNATSFTYPPLSSISIKGEPGLRGIKDLTINFDYPLTVICGKNRSGKTTLLMLAALGFHAPTGHAPLLIQQKSYYTFVDFFFKGPTDPDITGVKITWSFKNRKSIEITKTTSKWMHYERRPPRPTYYLGMSRIVPAIELQVLRNYFYPGSKGRNALPIPLTDNFRERLGDIMGQSYTEAQTLLSAKYSCRSCTAGDTYSSFNMGAGEDGLILLMHLLQEAREGALVVVDEIEMGLHPEALTRLAAHLQEIIHEKKLQVIVSTHSQHFIDSVPRIARQLVQRMANAHNILPHPTTRYSMGLMSGTSNPEMYIYCEDEIASAVIWKSLCQNIRKRIKILPIGEDSQIANQALYHFNAALRSKILLIWDGEVTIAKANHWLIDLERKLGEQFSKLNWKILPGNHPPENWLLNILNNTDGHILLAAELGCTESESSQIIAELLALSDHHDIPFELARRANLRDENDSVNSLLSAAVKLSQNPLMPIRQAVEDSLAGQHVTGII